jgi:hypothetical protein
LPVAPADANSEEADAGTEDDEVEVLELEALLLCEVVEDTTESDAVGPVADASSAVEVEESFEKSSESL